MSKVIIIKRGHGSSRVDNHCIRGWAVNFSRGLTFHCCCLCTHRHVHVLGYLGKWPAFPVEPGECGTMTRSLIMTLYCLCLFLMDVFPKKRKTEFAVGQRSNWWLPFSTTKIAISMRRLPGEVEFGGFCLDELYSVSRNSFLLLHFVGVIKVQAQSPAWPGTHYLTQAGFEPVAIFLPQHP